MQKVTILGATGSIGVSTLDVLSRHPKRYTVYALTANSRWEKLAEQCRQFNPRYAVLGDEQAAELLRTELSSGLGWWDFLWARAGPLKQKRTA